MIDKLNMKPTSTLEFPEDFIERGLVVGRIESNRICLKAKGINLLFSQRDKTIYKIVSNPSKFECFEDYLEALESYISPYCVTNLNISRIDLAVDVKEPFEDIYKWMVVNGPSSSREFSSKAGKLTGLYFGKEPRVYRIYCKTTKHKLDEDVTRIEVMLFKKFILFKELSRLDEWLFKLEPFKNISIVKVSKKQDLSVQQKEKLSYLNGMIDGIGFNLTKKRLNISTNKNFHRIYGKLISISEDQNYPLDKIFKNSIYKYFIKTVLLKSEGS